MSSKRLGRGLGSLIQDQAPLAPKNEVSVSEIRPNPFQPRRVFDPAGLEELRNSILAHGVMQPIVVRAIDTGYQLVSGERRWRASRLAGLTMIPAVIREDVSDHDMLELALVENVQRRDLNAIERGIAFRELMTTLGLTQLEVADKVGLKRSSVANQVRLLELNEKVQELIAADQLSMGHGRALLGLKEPSLQVDLAESVVKQDLSVRQTEALVREMNAVKPPKLDDNIVAVEPEIVPWARAMEDRIRDSLGTKVSLKNGPKYKGQIVIHYFSRDDLERIYDQIAPREEI
ncbi:MAG: ParB/RepB/Spo0J family partition protein [Planctomycetota bacterium]|jgi:ParB family transcriptional regulator, chromosome partitioning protein|nr:ParB/RepB/Spo0J family partition protein [Planctomycetota bacterium]MDG2142289.1 ParB/RepB/Spo0J family partition protein [Planctomycetota bacterium]